MFIVGELILQHHILTNDLQTLYRFITSMLVFIVFYAIFVGISYIYLIRFYE